MAKTKAAVADDTVVPPDLDEDNQGTDSGENGTEVKPTTTAPKADAPEIDDRVLDAGLTLGLSVADMERMGPAKTERWIRNRLAEQDAEAKKAEPKPEPAEDPFSCKLTDEHAPPEVIAELNRIGKATRARVEAAEAAAKAAKDELEAIKAERVRQEAVNQMAEFQEMLDDHPDRDFLGQPTDGEVPQEGTAEYRAALAVWKRYERMRLVEQPRTKKERRELLEMAVSLAAKAAKRGTGGTPKTKTKNEPDTEEEDEGIGRGTSVAPKKPQGATENDSLQRLRALRKEKGW